MSLLFLSTGEKFEHSGAGERRKTRCGCLENDENIYKNKGERLSATSRHSERSTKCSRAMVSARSVYNRYVICSAATVS